MTPSTLSASAPGADRPLASVGSAPRSSTGSSTGSSPGAPPDISPGASPGPSAGHGRKRAYPLERWLHHPAFSSQMTVVLLVLLLTVGGVLYDGFAAPQVMLNLLIDNAYLLVLAVGMSLVILSGGIDLSVGAVLALSTTVAAWLLHKGQWPAPVVMGVVLAGGTLFGVMQGALIHLFRLQPFIVTLAGMFLARGLCYLISVDSITISDETFVQISQMQIPLPGGFLSPGAVMALMLLAVGIWLAHRSGFGRAVYALGGNESSALMMGLPVGRTKLMVYGFSGFCASLAGLLFGFYMLSGYGLHAQGAELDAIAAVVIGGTMLSGGYGYVAGALSGVLVLGTIQTLIAFDGTLSSWWTKIVIGGLLFVFCVVQRLLSRPLAGSAPGTAPMG